MAPGTQTVRASPSQALLCLHACIFGAFSATSQLNDTVKTKCSQVKKLKCSMSRTRHQTLLPSGKQIFPSTVRYPFQRVCYLGVDRLMAGGGVQHEPTQRLLLVALHVPLCDVQLLSLLALTNLQEGKVRDSA